MAKQTESTEKKEKERTLEEAFLRLDESPETGEEMIQHWRILFWDIRKHRSYKVLQSAD